MDNTTLRKLQLTELGILRDVHALCKKHGITYYLSGGTLLGSIRHGGFIPWDDDLDIIMPRPDYERFIALCLQGMLGDMYYLHHYRTDPSYYLPFAKIRKNNTLFDEKSIQNLNCHKGIFIDISPLDYAKRVSGIWYHLKPRILRTFMVLIGLRCFGYKKVHIAYRFLWLLTMPLSIHTLNMLRDKLARSCKSGKYFIEYSSNYDYIRQTLPVSVYQPASEVVFEGISFPAPHDTHNVLTSIFGDYMRIPAPEERMTHGVSNVVFDTGNETKETISKQAQSP